MALSREEERARLINEEAAAVRARICPGVLSRLDADRVAHMIAELRLEVLALRTLLVHHNHANDLVHFPSPSSGDTWE